MAIGSHLNRRNTDHVLLSVHANELGVLTETGRGCRPTMRATQNTPKRCEQIDLRSGWKRTRPQAARSSNDVRREQQPCESRLEGKRYLYRMHSPHKVRERYNETTAQATRIQHLERFAEELFGSGTCVQLKSKAVGDPVDRVLLERCSGVQIESHSSNISFVAHAQRACDNLIAVRPLTVQHI